MREPAATLVDAEALGLLAEPTRRALYELIASCSRPVSRRELADSTGVDRALVAYHLDKLVEHGLLETTQGCALAGDEPRTGRPPKLYRRAEREFMARAPARDYRLAAEILLAATDGPAQPAVERAAAEVGRELGAEARARGETLADVLRLRGYEPGAAEDGHVRLRNCPFDRLAAENPELVCGLNLALVQGVLRGLGDDAGRAALDPQPGRCCVAIR
jgi:predicted ArsR family transcriptional regulator